MRWMALGLSMALCVFGATGCGDGKAPDAADASPVKAKMEWRLVSHTPAPDYAQADYHGQPVYLAPQPLLVVENAATVAPADNGDGQPALDLRFPGHGQRLTQATEQNVGKPIALLADGRVLTVATIMAPLPGDSLRISGLQDVQEQQRAFALLTRAPAADAPAQDGKR
ncbi:MULTISPECIES: SecDF P1 head subdomain-containing protein [Xanthomonas]|uniref:Preprotein translocase subunit SecD n=1 Tax=Xanthomonas rydalmerensis TaxID=3046274 RepID=A0ABZ0JNS0_9XANT|nr:MULTISPECIES: preprotein translocase subunit SecD [unclassified Xanthomonas]MBB5943833.1 preprotein translocase subunit SecD [Xanthomonas sp. 3307]MXV08060.1 preprotein translocase subunit SecD [Xanthomonas sp. LMG 9002]WOS41300.1 preprotein translocase subunit SecD [Xanthomonas sp. DM-2023]WOS45485.1 preprotein translocase subunit SecD [Xanthomonas sp. DM-2023]WOS49664.1 preprotein translocase subunit SecD [Xanthomonas sp. DM-2023]